MTNASLTLYVGVTRDLPRRVYQHKHNLIAGFTTRYHINKLVYYEQSTTLMAAVEREKSLKGLSRSKKIALIESLNPEWRDLSMDFMDSV